MTTNPEFLEKSENFFFKLKLKLNLLKTLFPNKIKKINFHYFIRYDLSNVLPNHSYIIKNDFVIIYNLLNKEISFWAKLILLEAHNIKAFFAPFLSFSFK